MSGRGETPHEDEEMNLLQVDPGETLYTDEGDPVGEVRGVEEGGLFVTVRSGIESLSIEHARSGHAMGIGHLMWRCMSCGEMGQIEGGLPGTCPSCGDPREDLMYWTED